MSTLFLRNQYLLFLTIAIVGVAGASAVLGLPRLEDPRITMRNVTVLTRLPGASADRVEALVTEKLEDRLAQVAEIKHIQSVSRAGISVLSIELLDKVTDGENDAAFSKIRDKLAEARRDLPADATAPELDDQRGVAAYSMLVAVTWMQDGPPRMNILNRFAEDLSDRLRKIPGTEYVRLYGEPAEEVTVELDADEAARLGMTPADVARLVAQADVKVPAGAVRSSASSLLIEVEGEVRSLDRVRSVPLRAGGGTVVRLGDIAEVRRGWRTPPTEVGLVNGRRALFVGAVVQAGQQVDAWAAKAEEVIAEFNKSVGEGVAVGAVFDQSEYTVDRLLTLSGNLVAGSLVVMAVVFVTMGWRAGLLVGSALPLSTAIALFGVLVAGGSLHQMSIFGMIIALGLLIDNAIVVVDEIRKRREAGDDFAAAVRHAGAHLFAPLLASSLTTVLAFAPIVLMPGNAGDFVGLIGGSVMLAIVASFFVSLTVVAALAGLFGDFAADAGRRRWWRQGVYSGRLIRLGERGLRLALRRPASAMLLACAPALIGFAAATTLGNQFFPLTDRDMCEVQVWLPRESSVANTRRAAERVEAVLREDAAVTDLYWLIGASFPAVYYNQMEVQDASPHYAKAVIRVREPADVKRMLPVMQRRLDREFPGAQIVLKQFAQGPPSDAGVQYRLYGPSVAKLQDLGERIRRELQSHPAVLHTMVTMPRGEPKLWLRPDEEEARAAGMSLDDIAAQYNAGLEGRAGGSLVEGLDELPVRVRLADAHRRSVGAAGSLSLATPAGDIMPAPAVGGLALKPTLGEISRYDGIRCNIIKAYCRNGALPIDVARGTLDRLKADGFELPRGYFIEQGGDAEQEGQAVENLLLYAPVLMTLAASTVILVFRSLLLAGLLGVVALMSIGLGLLSTWAYGLPFSFNTILGSLGLIGVAINDSIVVLAAIRANPAARAGDRAAVVGEAVGCARHVISTTLTTVGGFLPLLLFVGGDFWPALAIVLAGGVGGATVLALVFIPAAYGLFHRPPRGDLSDSEFPPRPLPARPA